MTVMVLLRIFADLGFYYAFAARSEERRVGKEC